MELDKIIEQYDLDKNKIEKLINKLCDENMIRKLVIRMFIYLMKSFNSGEIPKTEGFYFLELMEDLNVIDEFYECIEGRLC